MLNGSASYRLVADFVASAAYRRVKSMSRHVFMVIHTIEFISKLYKQGNSEARRGWPAQNKREAGRCGFWVLEGEAGNNISSKNAKQSTTMKKL